jgi:hypothetical protein
VTHGIDSWRNWTPEKKEILEAYPNHELPKPPKPVSVSFGSAPLGYTPNISAAGSMANPDPAAWEDDLCKWASERCTRREGCEDWGGVGALHTDFAQWTVDHASVPCSRITFEALLRSEGFLVRDGLVQGMFLTEDLWAIRSQASDPLFPRGQQ